MKPGEKFNKMAAECMEAIEDFRDDLEDSAIVWAYKEIKRLNKGSNAMTLNEQQRAEFDALARPLLKFLCENCHPHVSVIVTPTNAELLEGCCSTGVIMDYVRD